jgi:hypothetical protein
MIKFREQRGSLAEALTTMQEFASWPDLLTHVRGLPGVGPGIELADLKFHRHGERVDWQDTYLVTTKWGVVGFTDGVPQQEFTESAHCVGYSRPINRPFFKVCPNCQRSPYYCRCNDG